MKSAKDAVTDIRNKVSTVNKKIDRLEEVIKTRLDLMEKVLRDGQDGITYYQKDVESIKESLKQLNHRQTATDDMLDTILNVAREGNERKKEYECILDREYD